VKLADRYRFDAGIDFDDATRGVFQVQAAERELYHLLQRRWSSSADLAPVVDLGPLLASAVSSSSAQAFVLDVGGSLLHVMARHGNVWTTVAADSRPKLDLIAAEVARLLPEEEIDDERTHVVFWSRSEQGPMQSHQNLVMPRWPAIVENYPESIGGALGRELMAAEDWRPDRGRLVLWHGPPGTGKTYALRALMREWRSWCDFHYIIDPDAFFGSDAGYMMQVVLGLSHMGVPVDIDGEFDDHEKWHLLILEDAGELLAVDARERVGQALSRLLNIVDGLLGQGLKLLLLVTTNEPVGKLHPAVVRPGRCAGQTEFRRFDPVEARVWLEERGAEGGLVGDSWTLAELYARLYGYSSEPQTVATGFAF
jgi:hypothetical protein